MKVLEVLYRKNYEALYRAARNILHDPDTSHDVVMDLFVDVARRHRFFGSKSIVLPYLVKAVVNRSLNYIRKRQVERERMLPLLNEPRAAYALSPRTALEKTELDNAFREAMNKMPRKTKAIFILHRRFNMKYREIATRQGISVKTVEKHMSAALKVLRRVALGGR